MVRCRPMNQRERELNCQPVVTVDSARGQCSIQNPGAPDEPPKQFTFDGAYYVDHFTEQIYNEIAYPLVEVRAPRGAAARDWPGRAWGHLRGPEGMALTPELGGNALLEAVGGHPQVGLKSLSRQETAGTHLQRPHPGVHGPQGQSWPSPPPPSSSLPTRAPASKLLALHQI